MTTWHARMAFTTDSPFSHDAALDLLSVLTERAAAVAPRVDATGGDISFTIEADAISAAFDTAMATVTEAVAAIAGFPAPVITTAQGPLMTKAAVERWLENRNTRPGRPAAGGS